MSKDSDVLRVELMFKGLDKMSAANSFPAISSLANSLNKLVGNDVAGYKKVDNTLIGTFATASVEMWHRAIHSLLISASLTSSSTLWSSVAGYYSSHYCMRAIAHLLGYFQLFTKGVVVQLELDGKNYLCKISKKDGGDREHKYYWKVVKQNQFFNNDPLFYYNNDTPPPIGSKIDFRSDGGHRNRANYSDHIGHFPVFAVLDHDALERRIQKLSGIYLNDVPIPNVNQYPDIENVQLLALHRILKYRAFLDDILPEKHRFWAIQRNPAWKPDYFDFQVVGTDYSGFLLDLGN